MKNKNLKQENIYLFRSERNTKHNHGFYNPSKFFVEIVDQISFRDINIIPFIGVTDDAGNKLDLTAKEIHDFENGKRERLIIEWDGIYDTSYFIRERGLTETEREMAIELV